MNLAESRHTVWQKLSFYKMATLQEASLIRYHLHVEHTHGWC